MMQQPPTNGSDPNTNNTNNPQQQQQWWQQQQQQQQYQQQQWMGMQYPAAAMTMMQQHQHPQHQQHMMPQAYSQQYMAAYQYQPQQQQQQQQQLQQQHQQQPQQIQVQGGGVAEENRTVWVGDLHHWMDESYLHNCFSHAGEVGSIKVIRNKQTGQSEGYGFIEFFSHAAAEKVLQSYNGTVMPNTEQPFRLNWASSSSGEKRSEAGSDLSIFVGDLAADVTDTLLQETFASRYQSVKGAKVVTDPNTGRSKGYGFVRFGDENEKSRAMTEMNGMYCSSRPMRIGVATPKKFSSQGSQFDGDSTNTTIFVGGLDSSVTDEDLRHSFSQFGEVVSVKIPVGKGCGFVQYANRNNAEEALNRLNGAVIGSQTVRLSWGRNPGHKQSRGDASNQWNGAYYGGQGYDGYGYGVPQNQDPNMYAAAASATATPYAGGYGDYQQQVS